MKSVGLMAFLFALCTNILLAEEMQLGKPITVETTTDIAAILADPNAYVDETVRIEGTVVDVCTHMGCWMEIATEDAAHHIQVKVEDGVIVFPQKAKGRTAIVQGKVQKLELSLKQTVAYLQHEAEEKGTPFEPESVKEPRNFYRIWVDGAIVK